MSNNEYETVTAICRRRARSGNHKIIGNRIVGTEPEEVVIKDDADDFVTLEFRITRKTFQAVCRLARSENRSVRNTMTSFLTQTIIYMLKKLDQQERRK
jgi:hypothetical protein